MAKKTKKSKSKKSGKTRTIVTMGKKGKGTSRSVISKSDLPTISVGVTKVKLNEVQESLLRSLIKKHGAESVEVKGYIMQIVDENRSQNYFKPGAELPENLGKQFDGKKWIDHPYSDAIREAFKLKEQSKTNDPVNNPQHYTDGKIEVIDFIEDKKLGFHLGNAIKYIARAGKKDPSKRLQDLKKAEWYLKREIKNMEEKKITTEKEKLDPLALGILGVGFLGALLKHTKKLTKEITKKPKA